MRNWTLATLVLAALALPATALAQISIGARIGYAKPDGEIKLSTGTVDQSDFITSQVPVQLDLDYRLPAGFTVGVYGSYGFGQPDKSSSSIAQCDQSGITCQSAITYRVGAQATWTMPFPVVKPWLGAGIGYEWSKITREGAANVGAKGPEKLNLQLGLDVELLSLRVGPFITWTTGAYQRESISTGGTAQDVNSAVKNGWLYYGARVRWDL